MSIKYRTSAGTSASNFSDLVVKVGDTLPIGSEIDYDGQTVPAGWQEVDDPNVYSTTEKRIGTWIDGKPLYRKVIPFTRDTTSNSTNITHNISNLGDVVKCYGYFKDGIVTRLIPQFYYADMTTYSISIYSIDATKVALFYGDWYRYASTITNSYVVLEYTKTTD